MLAAAYAFGFAFLLFALADEADTPALRVIAFVAGAWMAISGAASGWLASRK